MPAEKITNVLLAVIALTLILLLALSTGTTYKVALAYNNFVYEHFQVPNEQNLYINALHGRYDAAPVPSFLEAAS